MENRLEAAREKSRKLYRELFAKASELITARINSLRPYYSCADTCACFGFRYSELSPAEVYSLSVQGERISQKYIETFVPFGEADDWDYSTNEPALEANHNAAREYNSDYVDILTQALGSDVYFYRLRTPASDMAVQQKSTIKSEFAHSVTEIFPSDCNHRDWQKAVLNVLNNEVSRDVLLKLKDINDSRKHYSCEKCGTCCKMACSEFSYDELKLKAKNGDKFATEFISVFQPYESAEAAREVFPDYYDMVCSKLGDQQVYFYRCPHVTDDNLCSRYDQRPGVCREFPSNPLSILPYQCGYYEWKEDVEVAGLLLHAMVEIIEFTAKKIECAVS